jgi:hypothetical protein
MSKQKHLLEVVLSSADVFSQCVSILKSDYFDGEVKQVMRFVLEYYEKYRLTPDWDTLAAEYPDVKLKPTDVTSHAKIEYACEELETYCVESAVIIAMNESGEDLIKGEIGKIVDRLKEAVSISLKKDLGWEVFGDGFLDKLTESLDAGETTSTGVNAIDKHLGGGFARKQITLFTANSGTGKSVMLNNLAHNFAASGHRVVLLSLEIPKTMVFVRTTAITSGFDIGFLAENKEEISQTMDDIRKKTEGSLIVQRLPGGSSANDIRSYLAHYELEHGCKPDALFVDYLDKMSPNQGVGSLSISEQDKIKTAQLYEVVHDFNLFCATASQQNRGGVNNPAPQQDVIAGGITKINEVDNVGSLYMDDQMKGRGELWIKWLKTRSSSGVGKSEEMFFDEKTLRMLDPGTTSNHGVFDISRRKKAIDNIIKSLPGVKFDEEEIINEETGSSLLDYMENLDDE